VGYLALKEIGVSLINGAVWGGVMGLIAAGIYRSMSLGLVIAAATLLNMGVAALVGFGVPGHELAHFPCLLATARGQHEANLTQGRPRSHCCPQRSLHKPSPLAIGVFGLTRAYIHASSNPSGSRESVTA
jgi:hypothetical protein